MSEALIFASTNPQYDNRFFIQLPVQYMKIASSERSQNMWCTQIVFCFDIQNNLCTQHVLRVFWACNFHVLNNEQSVVILWVSWCKNKSFWQRFTYLYQQAGEKMSQLFSTLWPNGSTYHIYIYWVRKRQKFEIYINVFEDVEAKGQRAEIWNWFY